MPKPADPETFQEGYQQAMEVIRESDVTAPNEGGLSMYGTNVLMNATEEMDGLPAKNAKYTSTEAYRDAEGVDTDAERVSGENVRENILVDEPTCHSCPVACKKEVEVDVTHKGDEMNVRTESYEYESAWALGPNSGHSDRDEIALMLQRCNDLRHRHHRGRQHDGDGDGDERRRQTRRRRPPRLGRLRDDDRPHRGDRSPIVGPRRPPRGRARASPTRRMLTATSSP